MRKHNWIWHRPSNGRKQCLQCGMVISIQNHRKVGECKGKICDKCKGKGYILEQSGRD